MGQSEAPGQTTKHTGLAEESQQILTNAWADQYLNANRSPSDQLALNSTKFELDPARQLQASMLKLSSQGTGFQPGMFSSQALLPAIQVASKGVTDAMFGQRNKLSNQVTTMARQIGQQKSAFKDANTKPQDYKPDYAGAAAQGAVGMAGYMGQSGVGNKTTAPPSSPTSYKPPPGSLDMNQTYSAPPSLNINDPNLTNMHIQSTGGM